MRLLKTLIALLFVALGVVFGALNRQTVHVDLFYASYDVRLGVTLIAVLLAGALLGGLLVTAGVVWPMRRRLRRSGESGSGPDLPMPAKDPNP
jgi:putative membrane protein